MQLNSIQRVIRQNCGLEDGLTVLVGVSGGADSMCLADLLRRLGYRLTIAHFDHSLRPDSQLDMQFVREYAQRNQLAFITTTADVAGFARLNSLSLEEAARVLRYRWLFEQARQIGAQAVAVGHTADDQVETVVMHLLRGAGLPGLKGMLFRSPGTEWGSDIPLVRPLLGAWRGETESYCQEQVLQPRIDASNSDLSFFRNRLRHELIPILGNFQPRAKERIWQMARLLSGEENYLAAQTEDAWQSTLLAQGEDYRSFSLAGMRELHLALKRRIMLRAAAELRPDLRDVGLAAVERALDFIDQPPETQHSDWLGGLSLDQAGDALIISAGIEGLRKAGWLAVIDPNPKQLELPGNAALAESWALSGDWVTGCLAEIPPEDLADPLQAWLDVDKVKLPLVLRSRNPGDRFQPFGFTQGRQKLADFFTNIKLPRAARENWPLLVSGDEIVWVVGLRLGEMARVNNTTRRMLHLKVHKNPAV